ncbi:nucleic acid-binding protein [Natronolimnobius sp. AArcel1]|uniref:Zn-ribbon domain-containing OB-fold protein n=1 Tax=Natronolimnobius sp. AArcel1 TaxID=1679093 RepID=UPI0013EBC796|nr:OB-fold domain-containing protein [Natronolimnobius sp. AArcel1]NGM69743.1 nucleic acid-binding protein [Natronolimnobius sp. AArcel1]
MSDHSELDSENVRDAGFDDWLDAAEAHEAYYLECDAGHGSLPPRQVCPECGSTALTKEPLPEPGEIATYTVTHVATPSFADDAPYATAIADFGPVRMTGQVVEIDLEDIEQGLEVEVAVTVSETTGERVVAFQPV